MVLFNRLKQEGAVNMQNFDPTNALFATLIALYMANKVYIYIRYKKSGKIMLQVKLQKDIISKLLWVIVACALVFPVVRLYISGKAVPPASIKSAILWVCFISIVAFIETQAPRITEGGIKASGKFWTWKDIISCKWNNSEGNDLSIEIKGAFLLLKYPITLRWRVSPEQRLSISRLMKGKMK